uniref:Uncharacterized protein n=1 Tax=Magallana gigas TaxID=29159 RepID=K1PSV9_MAGGI
MLRVFINHDHQRVQCADCVHKKFLNPDQIKSDVNSCVSSFKMRVILMTFCFGLLRYGSCRGDLDDQYSWKQYRFRQFYLDVSDLPASETNTTQRTRCYTDNTTYPDLPPNIIDIPCQQTARYVIVETTYDAPEDDPTEGAILEICEIEARYSFKYEDKRKSA